MPNNPFNPIAAKTRLRVNGGVSFVKLMLNESVHVVEYDRRWAAVFASERDRLIRNVHVDAEQIEHIGSTAVVGLAAKPIIDIMLGVAGYPPSQELVESIESLGYGSFGEAGVLGRLYFRRRDKLSFNLHVVECGGHHWISNLALREYLRANGSARERYAAVKFAAIESGATDLLAYSESKASAVAALVSEALGVKANKTKEPTR